MALRAQVRAIDQAARYKRAFDSAAIPAGTTTDVVPAWMRT